jgi:hypothetical protein
MTDQNLKVQLLLTGNEIMSGDTVDSNSALIAAAWGSWRSGCTARSQWGTTWSC